MGREPDSARAPCGHKSCHMPGKKGRFRTRCALPATERDLSGSPWHGGIRDTRRKFVPMPCPCKLSSCLSIDPPKHFFIFFHPILLYSSHTLIIIHGFIYLLAYNATRSILSLPTSVTCKHDDWTVHIFPFKEDVVFFMQSAALLAAVTLISFIPLRHLIDYVFGQNYYPTHLWPKGLCLLAAGVAVWIIGRLTNRACRGNKSAPVRTVFMIKMEYWGIAFALVAVFILVIGL